MYNHKTLTFLPRHMSKPIPHNFISRPRRSPTLRVCEHVYQCVASIVGNMYLKRPHFTIGSQTNLTPHNTSTTPNMTATTTQPSSGTLVERLLAACEQEIRATPGPLCLSDYHIAMGAMAVLKKLERLDISWKINTGIFCLKQCYYCNIPWAQEIDPDINAFYLGKLFSKPCSGCTMKYSLYAEPQ